MYNAVRIFTDCGEYEKAEFYMDKVRRIKKDFTQNDCLTSMYLWEKLGKYVEAMDKNRKLINTSYYYLWMATHYWLAGDMENKDLYYSKYNNYIMNEADYESLIPKYTSDRKKKYEEIRNYYIANMLLGIIYEIKGDKYKTFEHYTIASKENPLGLFHCLRKKALEKELSI